MALSYDTLNDEACWRAQTVPPALEWLGAGLRAHYGVGRDRVGSPGDNNHLRGGHRSRRWIRESIHCTNRTYTVTYAADKLGDEDWYSAIDFDPNDQAELEAMCRRLDAAVRAGLFPEVSEWFGNLGGDQLVDGWNNITHRPASSDTSHLKHGHITFLRLHANNQPLMERLLAVLIGAEPMSVLVRLKGDTAVWIADGITRRRIADADEWVTVAAAVKAGVLPMAKGTAITDVLDLDAYGVDVATLVGTMALSAEDRAAIVADLKAALAIPTAAEIGKAVLDEDHRRTEG